MIIMKKYLTILTFLILFLPMWKACDGVPTKRSVTTVDESQPELQTIENAHKLEQNTGFLSIFTIGNNEICVSGYQIIWGTIKFIIGGELEIKHLVDVGTWAYFSFFLYALISVALVVFAFIKKKKRQFLWLSAINLCVIITSYILFLCILGEIYDIKYGFYLLIINSSLIFYSNFRKVKNKEEVLL